MDMDFIKEFLSKGFAVLKAGWGVLSSEISFAKYLYTYGKYFVGMAKSFSEESEQ